MKKKNELIEKIHDYFRDNYGYIAIFQIEDSKIEVFMLQPYVKDLKFEKQMDLLQDYIVSQGLADVTE